MRTALFLREQHISLCILNVLCYHLDIETPRRNSRLSQENISLLRFHLNSSDFMDCYKSIKMELESKVDKASRYIHEFKTMDIEHIKEIMYDNILDSIRFKMAYVPYKAIPGEKVKDIIKSNLPIKTKIEQLKKLPAFQKTIRKRGPDFIILVPRPRIPDDDDITAALSSGNGYIFGLD